LLQANLIGTVSGHMTEITTSKLRRVGGSVVISIPRRILDIAGLQIGDRIIVRTDGGKVVTLTSTEDREL